MRFTPSEAEFHSMSYDTFRTPLPSQASRYITVLQAHCHCRAAAWKLSERRFAVAVGLFVEHVVLYWLLLLGINLLKLIQS